MADGSLGPGVRLCHLRGEHERDHPVIVRNFCLRLSLSEWDDLKFLLRSSYSLAESLEIPESNITYTEWRTFVRACRVVLRQGIRKQKYYPNSDG